MFLTSFIAQESFEPLPAISPTMLAGCFVIKNLKKILPNSLLIKAAVLTALSPPLSSVAKTTINLPEG